MLLVLVNYNNCVSDTKITLLCSCISSDHYFSVQTCDTFLGRVPPPWILMDWEERIGWLLDLVVKQGGVTWEIDWRWETDGG